MDNTIFIILAVLLVIFFVSQGITKKRYKQRKSREFMEGRSRKEKQEGDRSKT